jgi:hypothetical protein
MTIQDFPQLQRVSMFSNFQHIQVKIFFEISYLPPFARILGLTCRNIIIVLCIFRQHCCS